MRLAILTFGAFVAAQQMTGKRNALEITSLLAEGFALQSRLIAFLRSGNANLQM